MVAIYPWRDVPFPLAPLTKTFGSLPHDALDLCPPLAVEQLLVSFISTHDSVSSNITQMALGRFSITYILMCRCQFPTGHEPVEQSIRELEVSAMSLQTM